MVVEGEKVVMEEDGGGKGTKKWRRWWRKWWGMVSDGAKCADKERRKWIIVECGKIVETG